MKTKLSPWRRRALGVCLCVATSGAVGAQVMPGATVDALPKVIVERLDDAYPGWTTARSGAGCDEGAAGLMVTADLDNDQTPDYGLVIATPDGTQHLVAILPRVEDAVIHVLGTWTSAPEMARLYVLPMGRKYRGVGATLDDYFSAQTLAAGSCSTATTAFIWKGVTFLPTVLQPTR